MVLDWLGGHFAEHFPADNNPLGSFGFFFLAAPVFFLPFPFFAFSGFFEGFRHEFDEVIVVLAPQLVAFDRPNCGGLHLLGFFHFTLVLVQPFRRPSLFFLFSLLFLPFPFFAFSGNITNKQTR